MPFKFYIFPFALLFISDIAFSQATVPSDSTKLYRNIENYTNRNKFTRFFHKLIFKSVAVELPKKEIKTKRLKKVVQIPLSAYEGKIIRHIYIETIDPLGHSIKDTTHVRQNILIRTGNKLHIKSQHITIRNLLIIHPNQVFDSLRVKESERLIRSQGYVRDVLFTYVLASKKSDSIDINIIELDKWSIDPTLSASPAHLTIGLTDKNFLGFGHESQNGFTWYQATGKYAFHSNYIIPNIRNTYISTTVQYAVDQYNYYSKGLSFDRPFYSPLTKWAGGITFSEHFYKDSIKLSQPEYIVRKFRFNTQDYWAGRAWQLFSGNSTDERTTNLVLTERFYRTHYLERPAEIYDSLHLFSQEVFYLSGIGISRSKFDEDHYIFNYGVTEVVPIGFVCGLTGGYQVRNNIGRFYTGMRVSFGNYNQSGYFSCNFEYGTFIHKSHAEQGIFTANINYFTNLFEIGQWKFRQFAKPQLTMGINRFSYENIAVNNESGIRGFSAASLTGTKKIALTLQTQSYSPWKLLGFRFGPYFIYSLEMLGNDLSDFKRSRLYSEFALGILIKNEYLVINVFQISIAFYPIIPNDGSNIFKINSNSTKDFGFRDFSIGKPSTIAFQ